MAYSVSARFETTAFVTFHTGIVHRLDLVGYVACDTRFQPRFETRESVAMIEIFSTLNHPTKASPAAAFRHGRSIRRS